MVSITLIIITLFSLQNLYANQGTTDISIEEYNYNLCTAQLVTGNYKYYGDQFFCEMHFDFPKAYLIKCLNFEIEKNYPTDLDRKACGQFFETNVNWGPWDDFELSAVQLALLSTKYPR